jgi:hypothetical protein
VKGQIFPVVLATGHSSSETEAMLHALLLFLLLERVAGFRADLVAVEKAPARLCLPYEVPLALLTLLV